MPQALVVAAVAFAGASAIESRRARKDTQKARQKQENLDQLKMARERQQEVRQTQIARSRAVAAGAAQGALGSSPVQGGAGSVITQGAENIAFSNQVSQLGQSIGRSLSAAATHQGRAADFQAISNIASAGYSSGIGGDMFKSSSPAPVETSVPI